MLNYIIQHKDNEAVISENEINHETNTICNVCFPVQSFYSLYYYPF